ncbi:sensor histidine kinase [Histomonas meleagridis]|uniref:sensor histidine kinase n=1 Tax=Histomonas meleagridis TaxID=135588 RepID=UPI00355A99E3|nr:sensor histidine kinase [Histomonas meleagridis]
MENPNFEISSNFTLIEPYLQNETTAFVYSHSITNFCPSHSFSKHIKYLSLMLTFLFLILLLLRLILLYRKVLDNIKESQIVWFCTSTGSPLSFRPFTSTPYKTHLLNLIKEVSNTKKNSMESIRTIQRPNEIIFTKLHVYYIINDIYMVILWDDIYKELHDSTDYRIENGKLKLNDYGTVTDALITSHFKPNEHITTDIEFKIDDANCKFTLKPNDESKLPLGMISLYLSYLDCLHINIFNEGISLTPTINAFQEYIELICEKLDFIAISVNMMTKQGEYETIASVVHDQEVADAIQETLPNIKANVSSNVFQLVNYPKFRLACNRFAVADVEYYIITVIRSDLIVFRSSERRFHFFLSILVAYHHSIISLNSESGVLSRIYKLLETSKCFAIVECMDKPNEYFDSHGMLFGESMTKDIFDFIMKNSDKNIINEFLKIENRQECKTHILSLKHPKIGDVWISMASLSYYDITLEKQIYMYLIEDVTTLNQKTIQLNEAHEDGKMVSALLGFHKVREDHTLVDPISLSKELGYSEPITSIDEIIYPEDKELFSKDDQKIKFRIISSLGHLVWYSAIRTKLQNGFFIFSSRELSQMQAICYPDRNIKENTSFNSDSFFIASIDYDSGFMESVVTNDSILSNIKSFYLINLKDYIYPDDYEQFNDSCLQIKEKRILETHFNLRFLTSSGNYMHFYLYLFGAPQKMILLLFNVDDLVNKFNSINETLAITNTSFHNSKMLMFAFENANYPERTFSTQPNAHKTIVFNWTTINQNVRKDFINSTHAAIMAAFEKRQSCNILIPLVFDSVVRWILIRGKVRENQDHISGIAVDLTNFVQQGDTAYLRLSELQLNYLLEATILNNVQQSIQYAIKFLMPLIKILMDLSAKDEQKQLVATLLDSYERLLGQVKMIDRSVSVD